MFVIAHTAQIKWMIEWSPFASVSVVSLKKTEENKCAIICTLEWLVTPDGGVSQQILQLGEISMALKFVLFQRFRCSSLCFTWFLQPLLRYWSWKKIVKNAFLIKKIQFIRCLIVQKIKWQRYYMWFKTGSKYKNQRISAPFFLLNSKICMKMRLTIVTFIHENVSIVSLIFMQNHEQ